MTKHIVSSLPAILLFTVPLLTGCGTLTNSLQTVSDAVQTVTDVTSTTSGALGGDDTAKEFVANNYDTLSAEAARGGGKAVDALAELLNESDSEEFARWLQMHYDMVFSETEGTLERIQLGRQSLALAN